MLALVALGLTALLGLVALDAALSERRTRAKPHVPLTPPDPRLRR